MSVIYTVGDVFEVGAPAIAHGVNCVGVMGGGIAKQVRQRYPALYASYVEHCQQGLLTPGDAWVWREAGKPWIVNLATQYDLNGAALTWINDSLRRLRLLVEEDPLRYARIAMPHIGAGLGGLQWEEIALLIERWFTDAPVQLEVVEWVQNHSVLEDSGNGHDNDWGGKA